jgi:4'-phosphopantetheinyl transferase EntD
VVDFGPLLDPRVRVAEMRVADADPAALPEAERAIVSRAVEKRRREFAAGRLLARRLLGELGVPPSFVLLRGAHRAPRWPEGVVGSITHSKGRAVVAVARAVDVPSVGIDLEAARTLETDLRRSIASPEELARLADPARESLVVFSAKEAFYKAQHALSATFIGFSAASVRLDPEAGVFHVELLVPAGPLPVGTRVSGRYAVSDGYVGTALLWPPRQPTT